MMTFSWGGMLEAGCLHKSWSDSRIRQFDWILISFLDQSHQPIRLCAPQSQSLIAAHCGLISLDCVTSQSRTQHDLTPPTTHCRSSSPCIFPSIPTKQSLKIYASNMQKWFYGEGRLWRGSHGLAVRLVFSLDKA